MATKIKVFYDGLCVLCSSEIETYKKMSGSESIDFIDITNPLFSAEAEDLDPREVHIELHAKDSDGKLHKGVEAFILIWSRLDKLLWLSRMAKKSPWNHSLKIIYSLFIKVRPYLPRRSCESSPYCPSHSHISNRKVE